MLLKRQNDKWFERSCAVKDGKRVKEKDMFEEYIVGKPLDFQESFLN